jgi:hypothetical protein
MSTLIQELDQPDLLSDNHRRSYAFGLVPPPKSSAPGIAPEDVTLRNITPGRPHRRARCHQCGTQSSLGCRQQSRRHRDLVTCHASARDAIGTAFVFLPFSLVVSAFKELTLLDSTVR